MNMELNRTKDPVCGMPIDPAQADYYFAWKGHKYYFCNEDCKRIFEQSPDRYRVKKRSWLSNLWHQYLERLNKATGGKPPSCCQ